MTLLDAIYDFFYNNVFSGNFQLSVHFDGSTDSNAIDLSALFLPINANYYNGDVINSISMRSWLSLGCTFITIGLILFCIFLLFRWLFKFVSGSILLK